MCSQGHQNLNEIGSPQTKQFINAYRKNSKEKKRAANNKQNNPLTQLFCLYIQLVLIRKFF